jgi:hypothetical protein
MVVWGVVRYTSDYTSSRRLYSSGLTAAAGVATVAAASAYTFLDRPAGSAGWIVMHMQQSGNATDFSYLQRPVNAYVDGESTPSYATSGTEDFATSSFYFGGDGGPGIAPQSWPWGYCTVALDTANIFASVFVLDLLGLMGGIRYTNGVKLQWDLPPAGTDQPDTSSEILYQTFYYE